MDDRDRQPLMGVRSGQAEAASEVPPVRAEFVEDETLVGLSTNTNLIPSGSDDGGTTEADFPRSPGDVASATTEWWDGPPRLAADSATTVRLGEGPSTNDGEDALKLTPVDSVERLLEGLSASGLVSRSEVEAEAAASSGGDVRTLADNLVRRGTLTTFQAETLLSGKGCRLVLGQFVLLSKLGEGGMGVVYEALDQERGERVALKTLPKVAAASLSRFKREFRLHADLTHPNLVTLYELFSDGDQWFFTLEKIDGVGFLTRVRPGGGAGADLDRLRDALRQLTEGLMAVHGAGLLHRDLKPSNVLVRPDGHVVILDFGLVAELEDALRRAGASPTVPLVGDSGKVTGRERRVVGTVEYMAPEQAAGLPLTGACDWYSAGVMLYEALTGRRPFSGPPERVLKEKQERDPPAPSVLAAGVPEDLDTLCMALLNRRPGSRPSGREVLDRLGLRGDDAGDATSPRPPEAPAFLGREAHLAALGRAYAEVQEGRATTVLVHGRSGVGKSSLVQHFLETLPGRGRDVPVVLAGRCYEQESVPYKAIDSLVDALSRHLAGCSAEEVDTLLPEDVAALAGVFPVLQQVGAVARAPRGDALATADRQGRRRRAFAALRELIGRIAARGPLVLVIDDLQWGDVDSAMLLADLMRPPNPPGLLLLALYRSEYAATSECLKIVLEGGGLDPSRRELAVEPLTDAETRALTLAALGRGGGGAIGEGVEAIAQESHGNPYFVFELVQHLLAGADLAALATAGLPVDLDEVLWSRVLRLPAEARRLLEVVAVAGRPLRHRDAFRAAGLMGEERPAVAALRSGKLVRSTGPRLDDEVEAFHDRIRESVAAHIAPEARKAHHRQLALVLEEWADADPETLAVHFGGAEQSEAAGRYYAIAADQAAEALAFDRAAKLYTLACSLLPSVGDEGRLPRRKLADALANAGRGGEAAWAYRRAALEAVGAEQLELRRRAAYQFCISGHVDEGRAAFGAILGGVGMRLPRSPRHGLGSLLYHRLRLRLRGVEFLERPAQGVGAEVLDRIDTIWSTAIGLTMIDLVPGHDFQARAALLSLRAGEPYRVARSLAMLASNVSTHGASGRGWALKLLGAAEEIARRIDHPHASGVLALSAGIAEFMVGCWKSALSELDRAQAILNEQCTGVAWEVDTCHVFTLMALADLGEFKELERRWEAQRQSAQDRGDLYALTALDTQSGTHVRLAADDPEGARRATRGVMGQWSREGFHLQHLLSLNAETLVDLYLGAGGSALARIESQWRALSGSLFLRAQVTRVYMNYLRGIAAISASRPAREPRPFLKAARREAIRLDRERVPWASAMAELIRAGILASSGAAESAARRYDRAAGLLDAVDMPHYASAARRRRGEALGGQEGRALVADADDSLLARGIRDPIRMTAMLTG